MLVDALVADNANEFDSMLPPSDSYDISRSLIPFAPPGLSLPHAHPPPGVRDHAEVKQKSRIVPTSAPFTPSRNANSASVPQTAAPLANTTVPLQRASSSQILETSVSQARQNVRSLATNTGLSRTIASQAAQGISTQVLRPDDFPVLEKGKEKLDMSSYPKISTPMFKKPQPPAVESAHTTSSIKAVSKKSTPGILSIAVPNSSAAKSTSGTDAEAHITAMSSAFPPLPSPATTSAPVQSPSVRNNPKTLRVVPTPRTEFTPGSLSTPQSASSVHQPGYHPPSRQPSLASLPRLDRPATPVSEIISEDASITSNSLSRPCSPPPTKIGSAPVRSTTKSHQKKQRREAQKGKEKTELTPVVHKPEPDVEIAPIMGRKKKQKKERISNAGASSPVMSRASSPVPHQVAEVENPTAHERTVLDTTVTQSVQSDSHIAEERAALLANSLSLSEETFQPVAPKVENIDEMNQKLAPTPSSIFADLVSSGVLDPAKFVMFKSPASLNQRIDPPGDLQDTNDKLVITDEESTALQAGKAVRKLSQGHSRIMLTPNGDCLRNLTPAEEDRYLELQQTILNDSGPAAFVSARHAAGNGFTLISGRAVPNGPPTFVVPGGDNSTLATTFDPVNKIQRDEALSYINQYVLPSLSTDSQFERALNASALDIEAFRRSRGDPLSHFPPFINTATFIPPSTDSTSTQSQTPYGLNHSDESFLQTGIESIAAHFALPHLASQRNVTLLSIADSESAMQNVKKETEKLEKNLNQLLKKNRRLLLGAGH